MEEKKEIKRRRMILSGVVLSDKMDKTVVVEVRHRVMHRTYKKFITRRVKYKAHDEKNQCASGDQVEIIESRPLSKDKRWRVQKIVQRSK